MRMFEPGRYKAFRDFYNANLYWDTQRPGNCQFLRQERTLFEHFLQTDRKPFSGVALAAALKTSPYRYRTFLILRNYVRRL